jgi:hypothetical protein
MPFVAVSPNTIANGPRGAKRCKSKKKKALLMRAARKAEVHATPERRGARTTMTMRDKRREQKEGKTNAKMDLQQPSKKNKQHTARRQTNDKEGDTHREKNNAKKRGCTEKNKNASNEKEEKKKGAHKKRQRRGGNVLPFLLQQSWPDVRHAQVFLRAILVPDSQKRWHARTGDQSLRIGGHAHVGRVHRLHAHLDALHAETARTLQGQGLREKQEKKHRHENTHNRRNET